MESVRGKPLNRNSIPVHKLGTALSLAVSDSSRAYKKGMALPRHLA
jgi:hypothetical protein